MSIYRHPSARRRRLRAAASLLAAASLAACEPRDVAGNDVEENAANAAEPAPAPVLPEPARPLGRAQLLDLVRRAADAAAAGDPLPEADKQLAGRSFEIRLPFGCPGEAERPDRWVTADFDAKRGTLRLSAKPPLSQADSWLAEVAEDQPFDTAEGFWIERPWTTSEMCPPVLPATSEPSEAASPTVAIVEVFAPDAPRMLQRGGRPYGITRKLDSAEQAEGGFRLALGGHIAAFRDGYPVHCRVESNLRPPICVVAAEFARIAFERVKGGTVLAEWPR